MFPAAAEVNVGAELPAPPPPPPPFPPLQAASSIVSPNRIARVLAFLMAALPPGLREKPTGGATPSPAGGSRVHATIVVNAYSQKATERASMLSRIFASAKLGSWNAVCGQRQVREWSLSWNLNSSASSACMFEKYH